METQKQKGRTIRTTKSQIVRYWRDNNLVKGFNLLHASNPDKHCWNCGWKTNHLQRCHIVPHMLGGEDTPSNYVLLCNQCHNEAPDVKNPSYMWQWIVSNNHIPKEHYNMYRAANQLEITEGITLEEIHNSFGSLEEFKNELFELIGFQQGRITVSTYYFALLELATTRL